jgi:hypothetical protein
MIGSLIGAIFGILVVSSVVIFDFYVEKRHWRPRDAYLIATFGSLGYIALFWLVAYLVYL